MRRLLILLVLVFVVVALKAKAASGPDLAIYKPGGWTSTLICSMEPGATTPDYTLKAGVPVYVRFAVRNEGNERAPVGYYVVKVGGDVVSQGYVPVTLDPGDTVVIQQMFTYNSTGEYTVYCKVDANGDLDELDESNNDFSAIYEWIEFGPDLVPYPPPGCSDPLVCSPVQGGVTAAGDTMAIDVPIHVRLGVINSGDEWTISGHYGILLDGEEVVKDYAPISLDTGQYWVYSGRNFTVNSVGFHSITGKVDYDEEVVEINEDNNDFSIDYYFASGSDLVPYAPPGWSAPCVCSNVPGDTTAGDTLAVGVPTHVMFAVKNVGNEAAPASNYMILVDGEEVVDYYYQPEYLEPGEYYVFISEEFIFDSPGPHTVTYVVDYSGSVDEINEGNNDYSVDCYWASGKDLVPYAPPGWSVPLVLSMEEGDTIGGGILEAGVPTYVKFAVANFGNETSPLGEYRIMLNEEVVVDDYAPVYLEPGSYMAFDKQFTVDIPGTWAERTVTFEVDPYEEVVEINERNNDFSVKHYWKNADLVPYTPSGWFDAIVASSVPGTHTHDLPPLFGDATTYIDWAVKNNGNLDIPSTDTFYICLCSDGVPLHGWYFAGLDEDEYVYVEDWEYLFSQGQHTLTLLIDSTGKINEGSGEANNRYSRDYFWNEPDWGGGGEWYSDSAEYIIITCDSLADAFEPLVRWKTKKGVYAKIFTVEDICANFSGDHTDDNASKIRNFIYKARESGAIYVLLGGQCDFEHGEEIVPRRDAFCLDYEPPEGPDNEELDTIPCDLYYSDLNRNWDMDFDGVYGEVEDAVDMHPDIFVGRAPVKNTQQVENFISKVMAYEKNPDSSYVKKIYLPQGNLWKNNHGTAVNDKIADEIPAGWQISKQYEDIQGIDLIVVNDSMNSGFNLQHWVGHGSPEGVYYSYFNPPSIPYYFTTDPPNNTNDSTKTSIISSIACLPGAVDLEKDARYDYDCLAERIVNVNKHAGVAAIMNTRYGWGDPTSSNANGWSEKLSIVFHEKLFNTSAYHLGEAVSVAKNCRVSPALMDVYERWVLYTWTLFGDPEMPVWTDIPVEMAVIYDRVINIEPTTMAINVKEKNSSVPIGNTYVCLWKENEVYKRGYTNASGDLSLEVTPETQGIMSITVTKENMLPYEGEISVGNETFFEIGKVSVNQTSSSQWHTVKFSHTYEDPIVIMGPPSYSGTHPSTIRVKDVNSNGFKFQIDEWDYLDGSHTTETIPYLVVEAGVHSIGGMTWGEAEKVENVNHNYTSKSFTHSFEGDQILLTQVVTYNGSSAVCTRVKNITGSSFQVKLQEEEGNDGTHSSETVHYIAVSPGSFQNDGNGFVSAKTTNSVTQNWYTIDFGQSIDSPLILANMNTEDGSDPAVLRYRNLSNSSVEIKVEEEESEDSEVNHTSEVVGYLVISTVGAEPSTFATSEVEEIYENYIKLSSPIISGNLVLKVSSNYDRKASIELIDIAGRVVERKNLNLKRGREALNFGQFNSGVYFLRIQSGEENESEVHKITVLR